MASSARVSVLSKGLGQVLQAQLAGRVAAGVNSVYALDAGRKWAYATGDVIKEAPTVVDGVVFIGGGGKVFALDAVTRNEEWAYATADSSYSSPTVEDGIVYGGSSTDVRRLPDDHAAAIPVVDAAKPVRGSVTVGDAPVRAAAGSCACDQCLGSASSVPSKPTWPAAAEARRKFQEARSRCGAGYDDRGRVPGGVQDVRFHPVQLLHEYRVDVSRAGPGR